MSIYTHKQKYDVMSHTISALLPTAYVREKHTRDSETKAPPPPAPVQVNGAKNFFTVRNILIFLFSLCKRLIVVFIDTK